MLSANRECRTFEFWFSPVEVGCVGKVFTVEVEALPKFHQFSQLLDECRPAESRFSSLLKRVGKESDGGKVSVERYFESRECCGASKRLREGVAG